MCTAQHGMARHGVARSGTAWHRPGVPCFCCVVVVGSGLSLLLALLQDCVSPSGHPAIIFLQFRFSPVLWLKKLLRTGRLVQQGSVCRRAEPAGRCTLLLPIAAETGK